MKIHFIHLDSWVEPGKYLAWAKRNGHDVSLTTFLDEISADYLKMVVATDI